MADALDRFDAIALVNREMEHQLKDAAAQRDAHATLFGECMNSEMMPYMRQLAQLKKESLNETEYCNGLAEKLTPDYLKVKEKRNTPSGFPERHSSRFSSSSLLEFPDIPGVDKNVVLEKFYGTADDLIDRVKPLVKEFRRLQSRLLED